MCGSLSLTLWGCVCVCECVLVVETIKIVKRKSQLCGNYYAQQSCLVAHRILVRVCPRGCHRHRSDLRRVASTERTGSRNTRKSWWHPRLILFILLFFQFDFVTFLLNACICQSSIFWLAKIAFLYFPPFHFDSRTTLINSSNILLRFESLTFRFGHGYGTE